MFHSLSSATAKASMRSDNPAENTREAGTGTLFVADAMSTRTFDTP
ncbi:hypothetical protein [Streptomyces sp. NBC_00842]